MKIARLGALCLGSVWFAACATAESGTTPGLSNGGATGSANGGAHAGGTSNGAFGGSAAAPGIGGSTSSAGAGANAAAGVGGSSASTSGAGGLASGGASLSDAGDTSAGGTGGGAPVFETGVCAQSPTVTLEYKDSSSNPRQITGQYQLTNLATTAIPLGDLKIRYFFTNEETSVWKLQTYSPMISGGTVGYRAITGTTFTEGPLPTPLDGADSYTEVGFPSGLTVEQNAVVTVSWDMQPTDYNPPDQVQTNDYSFNAADTAFTAWDHIAVYQGDTLIYGCVPQSLDDGAGGAGGAGGAAGAGGDTSAGGTNVAGGAGTSMGGSGAGTSGSTGAAGADTDGGADATDSAI